jgi:hypothetical protein
VVIAMMAMMLMPMIEGFTTIRGSQRLCGSAVPEYCLNRCRNLEPCASGSTTIIP